MYFSLEFREFSLARIFSEIYKVYKITRISITNNSRNILNILNILKTADTRVQKRRVSLENT